MNRRCRRKLLGRRNRELQWTSGIGQIPEKVCEAGVRNMAFLVFSSAACEIEAALPVRLDEHRAVEHHKIRVIDVFTEPLGRHE